MTEKVGFAFLKPSTKMSENEAQNLAKLGYAKPICSVIYTELNILIR
jgi:hypothetical protein